MEVYLSWRWEQGVGGWCICEVGGDLEARRDVGGCGGG